ncbi:MAG: hypothetical protein J4G14_05470 [Dehalococcoidia bacterium]|nr:hypothetical protein [Dehalococcoidia bacterium]
MSEEYSTLDYIDDIRVPSLKHGNSLNVLGSLEIGLTHLAMFTRQREIETLEEYGTDKIIGHFQNTGLTLMLACVFDWFSVSLVSYLRHVRLLNLVEVNDWDIRDLQSREIQNELRDACIAYIESVAPEVYQWRNKIGAHRAATDPRNSDNLTMLTYSTMPAVSYYSPYYRAGELRLTIGGGGELDIERWSLTEKYEALIPRYWPGQELPKLDW